MRGLRRCSQIALTALMAASCCLTTGATASADSFGLPTGLLSGISAGLTSDVSAGIGAWSFQGSPLERDYAHQVYRGINRIRANNSVAPLKVSPKLNAASWGWSVEMGRTGKFQHSITNVGENILFASSLISPDEMVQRWVNSPVHYNNLINEGYTITGVGISIRDDGVWVTQQFN